MSLFMQSAMIFGGIRRKMAMKTSQRGVQPSESGSDFHKPVIPKVWNLAYGEQR